MRRMGIVIALPLLVATALSWSTLTAPAVNAYGNKALWQIGLSFDCNNPDFCGPELGGFWGWNNCYSDNTADADLTGCSHLQGRQAPGSSGAGHFHDEATGWFIAPGITGMDDFWITGEEVTFVGHGPPVTQTDPFPPYPMDTGIPAVAGHYDTPFFFGFDTPPGVAFQVQVVQLPH